MNADLLLAVVPQTAAWSAKTASVMILSNIICMVAGRYVIQVKTTSPALPLGKSFAGFGLPELIATTSLGHVVGAGAILGLGYIGALN